jgi:hypothetical protein
MKEKDRVLTPEDRGHPDWAHYGAHQEVAKLLQQIYQYEGRGMSDVFPTFVGCCHAALDALPELVAAVLDGERDLRRLVQIADTKESQRLTVGWQRDESWDLMTQAFVVLLEATTDRAGELTYADVIGSAYMDVFPYRRKGQFKDTRAQFFTPHNVAESMAKMSLVDAEAVCLERLKQAVGGDPLAEALALMTTAFPEETERFFFERLLPYAVGKAEPIRVLDPCCGSDVMLLAAAKQFPRWAIARGLVQLYGVDIDPLCVEMGRLNMRLYAIEPLALRPVDALRLAELRALPWPYGELYAKAVTDAPPGRAHWEEGVDFARAQQLELWPGLEGLDRPEAED